LPIGEDQLVPGFQLPATRNWETLLLKRKFKVNQHQA